MIGRAGAGRTVRTRALTATLVATAAAAITYSVVFRAWGLAWTDPVFLTGLAGFVLVTWGGTALPYRGARGDRWFAARERRWIFGGVLMGAGELALLALCLALGVGDLLLRGDPAPDTLSLTRSVPDAVLWASVAWIYGSILTGLPLWLLGTGILIGPRPRTSPAVATRP